MKKSFCLLFALSIFLFGCKTEINPPEEIPEKALGSISGRVIYDNIEDSSGITVVIDRTDGLRSLKVLNEEGLKASRTARSIVSYGFTTKDGSYKFENLEDGTYTIYAKSDSSLEEAVTTNVVVSGGGAVTAEDLKLTPVGSIRGKITLDDSESNNAGFIVSIAGTSYLATTGSSGEFIISGIPAGKDYEIIIMYGTYTYFWKKGVEVKGFDTESVGSINFEKSEIISVPEKGDKGDKGDTGKEGTSIVWLGTYASADEIKDPKALNAFFNTTDGCSYIYDGEKWTLLASKGDKGETGTSTNGNDGMSIKWLGSFASTEEIENPEKLNAFFNTTDGCSYIYDGTKWTLLTAKGDKGENGTSTNGNDGTSINWLGSFASYEEIEEPKYLDAFFNTTDGCSYIYDGTKWTLLARVQNSDIKVHKLSYVLSDAVLDDDAPTVYIEGIPVELAGAYKNGYILKGWCLEENSNETPLKKLTASCTDYEIKLYPVWEARVVNINYVYDSEKTETECLNDGISDFYNTFILKYEIANDMNTVHTCGTVTRLPDLYGPLEFDGWCLNEDLSDTPIKEISDYMCFDDTINLYAKLGKNLRTYTMDYVLNDGVNDENNPSIFNYKSKINLKKPSREGYSFLGWYYDSEYKNPVCVAPLNRYILAETVSVYTENQNNHNAIFDGNGYWYAKDPITHDVTLYAKWTLEGQVKYEDLYTYFENNFGHGEHLYIQKNFKKNTSKYDESKNELEINLCEIEYLQYVYGYNMDYEFIQEEKYFIENTGTNGKLYLTLDFSQCKNLNYLNITLPISFAYSIIVSDECNVIIKDGYYNYNHMNEELEKSDTPFYDDAGKLYHNYYVVWSMLN